MDKSDLTRWNRAGLTRFHFINGNAATYLEDLRKALAVQERFEHWEAVNPFPDEQATVNADDTPPLFPRWQNGRQIPSGESEAELIERLQQQYYGDRGDWAWEIARVLARACHILTEYINAYANEGFIQTATQWDNVRKLIEMLDYHPAPPASATAPLAILAKENQSGTLEAGLQVKHTPEDGSEPVIFETLEDVEIDAKLNKLRPQGWDKNPTTLSGDTLTIDGEIDDLTTGEPLILEDENAGALQGYIIQGTRIVGDVTEVHISPRISARLQMQIGYTKIHAKPKDKLVPIGPVAEGVKSMENVLNLKEKPEELFPGQVIYISDGLNCYYRRILKVDKKELELIDETAVQEEDDLYFKTARVSLPVEISVYTQLEIPESTTYDYAFLVAGDWSRLTNKKIAAEHVDGSGIKHLPVYTVVNASYYPPESKIETDYVGYTELRISRDTTIHDFRLVNPQSLLVPPATEGGWEVDTSLVKENEHLPATRPLITSNPKKTTAGDLAVVVLGNQMAWARLASVSIDAKEEQAALTAETGWQDRGGNDYFLSETYVYAHFSETLQLSKYSENSESLPQDWIPLTEIPDTLTRGRRVLVKGSNGSTPVLDATVVKIDTSQIRILLSSSLPAGFTYGNTIIYANVVSSSHGETCTEKILGSGDAASSNQNFGLKESMVSFIPDATQSTGVQAAIDVTVDGQIWKQVSNLNYSEPTDPHYIVRMKEDETIKIHFGDGIHGRRLPSGTNNVKITYRKGSGTRGNLSAGSTMKLAKPHRLVEAAELPLDATGGNDMEGIESLRDNAPATLLTLERAVSLNDFAYLAASHSSVWQSKAFYRPSKFGYRELVEVIVVPAGGGSLGDLGAVLVDFLTAHALPGVKILVTDFDLVTFDLDVLVSVDSEQYNPDDVVSAVKTALEDEFKLEVRKLGQDVYLSEVYEVVESTTGVVHSLATLNANTSIKRVPTEEWEVQILGTCTVDYEGSATSKAAVALIPAKPTPPAPIRDFGKKSTQAVQGIGNKFSIALYQGGIKTIQDLADLDPDKKIANVAPIRLAEFRTKAKMILEVDIEKEKLTPLFSYKLTDLLKTSDQKLAQTAAVPTSSIVQLKEEVRKVEITLDEGVFRTISLAELVTDLI